MGGFICVVHTISLALWERWACEGSERWSSLAVLYGLACVVRFCLRGWSWDGCVGCEAVYVASEFPPSTADAVPLPQRGRLISGSCFAVATINCFLYKYKRGSYNKPRPLGRGGPVRARRGGTCLRGCMALHV